MQNRPSKSIFDYVRACVPESGPGLRDGVYRLPDKPVPGDQLRYFREGWEIIPSRANRTELRRKLDQLVREVQFVAGGWPGSWGYARLYRSAQDPDLELLLDRLFARLRKQFRKQGPPSSLHPLGLRLATEARHRGPVKLGIVLLGLFPAEAHRDVLLTLGRHEEFTRYVAAALTNGQAEPEDALWQLARVVTGDSRIELVRRLATTHRADIRDWILREGFRNSMAYGFLAHLAATRGDLLGRLRDQPDDDLLVAAAEILTALLLGGLGPDIADYADGAAATEVLIALLEERGSHPAHLLAVNTVHRFVSRKLSERRWPPGWTPELRQDLARRCRRIMDQPHWETVVRSGLASTDPVTLGHADRAARTILGISTLPAHLRLLRERSPSGSWYSVLEQVDEQTIDEVLSVALELFPPEEIATRERNDNDTGPELRFHWQLRPILSSLRDWPGRGWPLLSAALVSPVADHRRYAVRALAGWPRKAWPPDAASRLRAAAAAEPVPELKAHMTTVLNRVPSGRSRRPSAAEETVCSRRTRER